MLLVVFAVAIGAAVGACWPPYGGRVRRPRLVMLPALAVGVLARVVIPMGSGDVQGFWLGVSLVAITVFAVMNHHLVGMSILAVGVAANAVVVAVNGAMPVRARALVDAGRDPSELATLDLGGGRRFARTDDVLLSFADAIAVPPIETVVSAGDLVALVGVAVITVDLLRYARRGQPRFFGPAPIDP